MVVIFAATLTVLAINLLTFASLALSAFACHLLVRELTGSRLGALTAALFFAFNSYVFSHLAQLQLVSLQWIPLALLSLHRFFTRGQARHAWAFGIFLTLVGLASFYYLAFFSVALVILFPVYFWVFRGWRRPRQLAVLMAAVLGSAVLESGA